jgi:hypothetical protein
VYVVLISFMNRYEITLAAFIETIYLQKLAVNAMNENGTIIVTRLRFLNNTVALDLVDKDK